MKKLLSLTLALSIASIGSMALADDSNVTIWVTKAGDTTAKVCTVAPIGYDNSKCIGTVPISFASDASWDNVRDTYSVSSDVAAALGANKESIAIGSDGTATFNKCTKCTK